MNSAEEFCFEVPVIDLNNFEGHFSPKSVDRDCTSIERNQKESICVPIIESKSLLENHTNEASILIEDDEKDSDCTVVEEQIVSEANQTKQNNVNDNKNMVDAPKHHNSPTNSCGQSQESHSHNCNKKSSNIVEENDDAPIVLDEDSEENDCSIIKVTQQKQLNTTPSNKNKITNYDEILKEDKALAELTEKCLDMENSSGMLRIINRTLIPVYINTSDEFKKSDSFQRILTKTLVRLETEPKRKFSHLKEFCEVMKHDLYFAPFRPEPEKPNPKGKKRVQLTTLKRKLNGKFSSSKTISSDGNITKKKRALPVIDLDDDDDDDVIITSGDANIQIHDVRSQSQVVDKTYVETSSIYQNHIEVPTNSNVIPIINTSENMNEKTNEHSESENVTNDHSESDKVTAEHSKIDDDVIVIEDESHNSNKENLTVSCEQSKNMTHCTVPFLNCAKNQQNNYNHEKKQKIIDEDKEINALNKHINPQELLQPVSNDTITAEEQDKKKQIEELGTQIKFYNNFIKELETKEVNWESSECNSYYVQCESYKAKVVSIYKQLCKLTGTESVKRHKVRLKVAEGRQEGPTRCLEQFINSNIDEDGNPQFPDMLDVIRCVRQANEMHQLRWSKKEIEKEAQALFVHYGRTAQKKRQKREWRHLMRYVKKEDIDPADEDPILQARLKENAKLALKNEMDLLDRYAQMEYSKANYNTATGASNLNMLGPSQRQSDHDSDCEETFMSSTLLGNETVSHITSVSNNAIFNSNDERSSGINHVFSYVPSNVQQLTMPLHGATYAMRYIIIDENMKAVGLVPTPNIEALRNIEPLNNNTIQNNLKDHCEQYNCSNTANRTVELNNSSNTANRTVEQQIVGYEHEISNEIDMKPNLEDMRTTFLASNELIIDKGDNLIQKCESGVNENSEAYIDIKPDISDIEVTKSIQYDEVSTNSEAKIVSNVIDINKPVIDNNEVSSSTEVLCTTNKSLLVVNNAVISETENKTCGIVNDTCLEIDGKPSGLVKDIVTPDSENISSELLNNAESSETCGLVNNLEPTAKDKADEIVNDSEPSKNVSEIIVKTEKLDILQMLEALGDNYTVTILDIEDPFEVVEISDSSDSEDDL